VPTSKGLFAADRAHQLCPIEVRFSKASEMNGRSGSGSSSLLLKVPVPPCLPILRVSDPVSNDVSVWQSWGRKIVAFASSWAEMMSKSLRFAALVAVIGKTARLFPFFPRRFLCFLAVFLLLILQFWMTDNVSRSFNSCDGLRAPIHLCLAR
jgi:hypothetical protein